MPDNEVRGLIVEATGAEKDSQVTKLTVATFKALRDMADSSAGRPAEPQETPQQPPAQQGEAALQVVRQSGELESVGGEGINLSYTINLHLPPTSDIDVFNAIFKSLKEHFLQR